MDLSVINQQGNSTGESVSFEDKIFNIQPNDHVIYLDVRLILANRRQGTHKTKERGEVKGSTRKPYRQKGTGNARAGHMRSPLMRHGGTIFGPRPRSYGFKLNRKVKKLARRSALAYKLQEGKIIVVDKFQFDSPKTKDLLSTLSNLKVNDKKVLLVSGENNPNLHLSSRNVPKTNVVEAALLNTYDIINVESIVLEKNAVAVLHNILKV